MDDLTRAVVLFNLDHVCTTPLTVGTILGWYKGRAPLPHLGNIVLRKIVAEARRIKDLKLKQIVRSY